mmetsp:Transcript_12356/g.26284  ORF Transcript_12356/g.26284 Transcript_12356/m.26284 type:complete len:350 (+) Transcript_12356:1945-2994(+)
MLHHRIHRRIHVLFRTSRLFVRGRCVRRQRSRIFVIGAARHRTSKLVGIVRIHGASISGRVAIGGFPTGGPSRGIVIPSGRALGNFRVRASIIRGSIHEIDIRSERPAIAGIAASAVTGSLPLAGRGPLRIGRFADATPVTILGGKQGGTAFAIESLDSGRAAVLLVRTIGTPLARIGTGVLRILLGIRPRPRRAERAAVIARTPRTPRAARGVTPAGTAARASTAAIASRKALHRSAALAIARGEFIATATRVGRTAASTSGGLLASTLEIIERIKFLLIVTAATFGRNVGPVGVFPSTPDEESEGTDRYDAHDHAGSNAAGAGFSAFFFGGGGSILINPLEDRFEVW